MKCDAAAWRVDEGRNLVSENQSHRDCYGGACVQTLRMHADLAQLLAGAEHGMLQGMRKREPLPQNQGEQQQMFSEMTGAHRAGILVR